MSAMETIELPYSQGMRNDLVFYAAFGLCGYLFIYKPPLAVAILGALILLLSILGILKVIAAPRVVTIDPLTGIATFAPLSSLTRRFYRPISVRDYSSVYGLMSGRGKAYNVELSNHKGDSVLLFYKIQKSQAEKACAVISGRFGLTNRGLV